jgi:hypothetical protein
MYINVFLYDKVVGGFVLYVYLTERLTLNAKRSRSVIICI